MKPYTADNPPFLKGGGVPDRKSAKEMERQRLAHERRCNLLGISNPQELWDGYDKAAALSWQKVLEEEAIEKAVAAFRRKLINQLRKSKSGPAKGKSGPALEGYAERLF